MTTDIRSRITDYARTLSGLSADPADEPSARVYRDTIAPDETRARADEMALMSSCALTCRSILRRFIKHPILDKPYRDRRAVADLVDVAILAHGLGQASRSPSPGDMLIVGGGDDGGGSEHAWTVLDVVPDPGYEASPGLLVTGLDGGQRDAGGHQCISLRDHEIRDGWDVTSTGRRRIRYVLDVAAIVQRFGR